MSTIFNQSGQTVGVQVNARFPVSDNDLVRESIDATLKAALAFAQVFYDGAEMNSPAMNAALRKLARSVKEWPSELLEKYQG